MVKKKKKKRPQFNIWLEATKKFGPALIMSYLNYIAFAKRKNYASFKK